LPEIRVAIVGVGNSASALVQGTEYYKNAREDATVPGLMHVNFGGYHIKDVKFVAAFEVNKKKIGKDLAEAIFTEPNCCAKFAEVPRLGVKVSPAPTLDGVAEHMKETFNVYGDGEIKPVNVVEILKESRAEILVNYLPVGSRDATRFYAQAALDAQCAFINCLPYSEYIPVKMEESIQVLPIGKLVEELTDEERLIARHGDAAWYEPKKHVSVISFDPVSFLTCFSEVKRILKRKGNGSALNVTVQGGRRVTVSPDHLLLVLTSSGIVTKPAKYIKVGDLLPVASRLPQTQSVFSREIDLIQEFATQPYRDEIMVTGNIEELLRPAGISVSEQADKLGITYDKMRMFRTRKYLPLSLYLKIESCKDKRKELKLRFKKSKKEVPALLEINQDLARWLGLFIAEGWYHQTQVCISVGRKEKDVIQKVQDWARQFFDDEIHIRAGKGRSVELLLLNKLAVCILRDILGIKGGARKKEVPPHVYSWPIELVRAFLDGYFLGDGSKFYVSDKVPAVVLSASTASEPLIPGILVLLLRCGVCPTFTKVKRPATSLPKGVRPRRNEYRHFIMRLEGKDVERLDLILMNARNPLLHKTISSQRGRGIPIHARVPSLLVQPQDIKPNRMSRHSPIYRLKSRSYFRRDSLTPVSEKLRCFCNGDIYFAKVLRVQECSNEDDLYDFEIEGTHNFMHGLGVFSHNCMPEFIASDSAWAKKFEEKGLPVAGDDVKSQVGATILHRNLARLCVDRGVIIDETYQLNLGGDTDFQNMTVEERLKTKRISKTEAVTSLVPYDLPTRIGPSDYVPFLGNKKICYLWLKGRKFGDRPLTITVKLEVEDSPNSAGVVIDVIRAVKLALDRKIAGQLISISSYAFKHPPIQVPDPKAKEYVEEYINGKRER